jgi:hypothetical protein
MLRNLSIALFALLAAETSANAGMISYLPKTDVEHFIVHNLDLATFPSSIRPRLGSYHHFADVNIGISAIEPGEIHLSAFWDGWIYDFKILGRGDFNGDGIEDLAVCFTDDGHPTGGSYYAVEPLLLTRITANGPLIATALKPGNMRCTPYPQ